MNIMNHLTKKHMWMHKKRTIMTIIGVIISVAMITAVATATSSFMDLLQRREIHADGKWHVQFNQIDEDMFEEIEEMPDVDIVSYTSDVGYARFKDSKSQNLNKPYLYITGFDESAMANLPIELIKGRYPTNDNEIMLSEHLSTNGGVNYTVGDTIELELGDRYLDSYTEDNILGQDNMYYENTYEEYHVNEEKTFTVVGIIKRSNMESYTSPGYLAITYLDRSANEYDAYIFFDKITSKFNNMIQEFEYEHGMSSDSVKYHNSLLIYYGLSNYTGITLLIRGLSIILVLIITVGSISLIYNSFAISITERKKQFGMLASVGATKKQIRNSIFYEGSIIGMIAIPIGIIAGIGGMWITFQLIGPTLVSAIELEIPLMLKVSYLSIVVAILFSTITIFVAAYIPAKSAARISPIEAIRQSKDIKMKSKQLKVNKLHQKLYGIEGTLALKNLQRNKKRFNTLVFSLFISFVLFISVGSYVFYLSKTVEMSNSNYGYNIAVSTYGEKNQYNIYEELQDMEGVKELSRALFLNYALTLDNSASKELFTKEYKDIFYGEYQYYGFTEDELKENYESSKDNMYIEVVAVDDKSYKSLAKKLEINIDDNKGIPQGIFLNTITTNGNVNKMEGEALSVEKGDVIPFVHNIIDYDKVTEEDEPIIQGNVNFDIEVAAVATEMPFGFNKSTVDGSYQIIISEEQLVNIKTEIANKYENNNKGDYVRYFMDVKDGIATENSVQELMKEKGLEEFQISNYYQNDLKEKQMITIFSVFAYGFITLISLICVTNLCNTIATSFSLRRREFAMLKCMGMEQKSFIKMIYLESIMYGVKALVLGLPVGLFITFKIYNTVRYNYTFKFTFPIVIYIVGILFIVGVVGIAILYSGSKIRKESIILGLKSEID